MTLNTGPMMPIPRCDECRFWTRRDTSDDDWSINYADRDTPENRDEYARWGSCDKGRSSNGERRPDTLAWASDFENYGARLMTRESFGCVQSSPTSARVA
jgi:hypothetical protein